MREERLKRETMLRVNFGSVRLRYLVSPSPRGGSCRSRKARVRRGETGGLPT